MSAAVTGLRRAPVPLLPGLAWVVLSVVRIGDVAVLTVLVLLAALADLVRFVVVAGDRWPRVRPPALAAGGLTGLAIGAELGFGFGGGPGLVLVAATAFLAARLASVAALVGFATDARARGPMFAWRRCLALGLAVSVALWLVLLAGREVTDEAQPAVGVHGVRLDLPGGAGLLFVLIAVSLVGEGVLQYQAHRATQTWLTRAERRSSRSGSTPDSPGPIGPTLPEFSTDA